PGQVVVSATVRPGAGSRLNGKPLSSIVSLTQQGSYVHIGHIQGPSRERDEGDPQISYRIEVPENTEIGSSLQKGNVTIVGVQGPVKATTGAGNVNISYVIKDTFAQTESGDLEIEAVAGRVTATTGEGNIACTRVPAGVSAQTNDGDITLLVVGPSDAVVRQGSGKIDIGGARSTLVASTDTGELHIKAVPRQDWKLSSGSGTIRVELPPSAGFEIDAASKSGRISVKRRDTHEPSPALNNELVQKVNGGGAKIQARSDKGRIIIN
ncbi:MAG: DUF4097 family beta strand repeat-containing protein, partial [Blastocatellia bacterium]